MAGIVKKIGRITKYETTDYVGARAMLDLDRAARARAIRRSRSPVTDRREPDRRVSRPSRAAGQPAERAVDCHARASRDLRDLGDRARDDERVTFAPPTAEAQLAALRELAAELRRGEPSRRSSSARSTILDELLPGRALCVRVLDCARASRRARYVARRAAARRRRSTSGVIDHRGGARARAAQERGRRERAAGRARSLGLAVHRDRDRLRDRRSRPAASSTACSTSATRRRRCARRRRAGGRSRSPHTSRSRCARCGSPTTRSACATTRRACSRARTR